MEKLTPISESNFDIHVKRDMGVTIDFKRFFQEYIDKIPDFAIGPSFWLIPDQINMSFYSVSDNIHLFTPYTKSEWTGNTVQFWLENIHPNDRDFFLAATYFSIQLHTTNDHVNINMYLRMADHHSEYRWVLIQYPVTCLNEYNEVVSGLVIVTDISHLKTELFCMMTLMDKRENSNKFYTLEIISNELQAHDLANITKREKEILILMAKGLNTPQIAESLFISYHTVENHKRNLRHKTNSKTSAELMGYAFKYNLL
ncbi:MAG: LuxR family transcriptional regulator [Saprospiraceae bacterium]|nr:LuxR family transcriptional regulator [Saprospiraceae bacterium]